MVWIIQMNVFPLVKRIVMLLKIAVISKLQLFLVFICVICTLLEPYNGWGVQTHRQGT